MSVMESSKSKSRRQLVITALLVVSTVCSAPLSTIANTATATPPTTTTTTTNLAFNIPEQKSYSTNARNLDRLSAGDSSGGSLYDNNPTQPAARRRRAMQGCKSTAARSEAARILGMTSSYSEKECNMQVMQQGDEGPNVMLEAIRKVECPTCPFGIKP